MYTVAFGHLKKELRVFLCPRPTTFQLFTTHRPISLSSDISWGEKCRIIFGDIRVIRANTSPSLSLILIYFHLFWWILHWFSFDFHLFSWIFMDFRGFSWIKLSLAEFCQNLMWNVSSAPLCPSMILLLFNLIILLFSCGQFCVRPISVERGQGRWEG